MGVWAMCCCCQAVAVAAAVVSRLSAQPGQELVPAVAATGVALQSLRVHRALVVQVVVVPAGAAAWGACLVVRAWLVMAWLLSLLQAGVMVQVLQVHPALLMLVLVLVLPVA
jgi:hypothetical protein